MFLTHSPLYYLRHTRKKEWPFLQANLTTYLFEGERTMNTIVSVLQVARVWGVWRKALSTGVFALAVVILLNFGQPDPTVNTGGCSAPIGECSVG